MNGISITVNLRMYSVKAVHISNPKAMKGL